MKKYELPKLDYDFGALAPFVSEEQLKVHYTKHHQAYVDNTNKAVDEFDKAQDENADLAMKAFVGNLTFNLGGHILHSLYWKNMMPYKENNGPDGHVKEIITSNFGSCERFKKLFMDTASTIEGSGWAILFKNELTDELIIGQVKNHNKNIYPGFKPILVLDMWEHAYYIDYKNDKASYIKNFCDVINWKEVENRLK